MIAIDRTFSALGDPIRRAIVQRLALGEATVTQLAEPFPVSLPAISKHLRILEEAGLLIRMKEGRLHRCQLRVRPLQEAQQWLEEYTTFWNTRLDSLGQYLQRASSDSRVKEDNVWKKRLSHQPIHFNSLGATPPVPKRSSKLRRTRKR